MSNFFTNYLIKRSGKVVWTNKNYACFQEAFGWGSSMHLLDKSGALEIFILSGEIPLNIEVKDQSVKDWVAFINRNISPCSVKFHKEIPLSGDRAFDTRLANRDKKGCTGVYIVSLKLIDTEAHSVSKKRLKIAAQLIRFLYEHNLYLCVEHFLNLKRIKKEIKSRVSDFSLLGYTYCNIGFVERKAALWSGHASYKSYSKTYKLKDSYLQSLDYDCTFSYFLGKKHSTPANTVPINHPVPKNLEEFNNFTKFVK